MIYSAPRLSALSQRIASHVNFSLDYSIQLIFNFRFPIFELVAKKNLFDILLCPFFLSNKLRKINTKKQH